jgi:hypothetical protein
LSIQPSALELHLPIDSTSAWRSRSLSVILMIAIAGFFWVDSRYPALMKRYQAGTQVKASGELTFGTIYPVDRSMPVAKRVFRTTPRSLILRPCAAVARARDT